jgi:hypothetical protein
MALEAVSKLRRGDAHLDVLTDLHSFYSKAREIPTSGAASAKVYVMGFSRVDLVARSVALRLAAAGRAKVEQEHALESVGLDELAAAVELVPRRKGNEPVKAGLIARGIRLGIGRA